MKELLAHIHDVIGKQGAISVADYMELALQHPEFGYYRKHDPLGREGDFITAPEISQMFGEMIGLWCADVWREMGKPEKFLMLELGPGRGTLMQDALRASAKINGFHQAMTLGLIESNLTLRSMQTEKLAAYNPVFLEDLAQMPWLPVLAIANEFFDALPIRQFEKNFQGWYERLVAVEQGKLIFTPWPLNENQLTFIPSNLRNAVPGSVYELSLPSLAVMRVLAQHISRHGGAALIADYGYAEPFGKPSLQAVAGHQYANVLDRPGEVDLTAHVDFSALANMAAAQETVVSGPIGQGEFLNALGMELRAIQLKQRATAEQAKAIDQALHRLTDSSQMGTLFKVMAISTPQLCPLPGF